MVYKSPKEFMDLLLEIIFLGSGEIARFMIYVFYIWIGKGYIYSLKFTTKRLNVIFEIVFIKEGIITGHCRISHQFQHFLILDNKRLFAEK